MFTPERDLVEEQPLSLRLPKGFEPVEPNLPQFQEGPSGSLRGGAQEGENPKETRGATLIQDDRAN